MSVVIDEQVEDLELIFDELRQIKENKGSDSQIEQKLREAEEQMALIRRCLPSLPSDNKKANIRQQLKKCNECIAAERRGMLVSRIKTSCPQSAPVSTEHRNLQRLVAAAQQLAEAEECGRDSALRLSEQEKVMLNIKHNLVDVNNELNTSNSLIRRMLRWWRS